MDDKKLNMIMTVLKVVLVVIGVIACALVITGPNGESEVAAQNEFRDSMSLGLAINYTMYIVLGGVAVILVFFGVSMATTPKKTAMSIVGISFQCSMPISDESTGSSKLTLSISMFKRLISGT